MHTGEPFPPMFPFFFFFFGNAKSFKREKGQAFRLDDLERKISLRETRREGGTVLEERTIHEVSACLATLREDKAAGQMAQLMTESPRRGCGEK